MQIRVNDEAIKVTEKLYVGKTLLKERDETSICPSAHACRGVMAGGGQIQQE
jgi:hypothetical protein